MKKVFLMIIVVAMLAASVAFADDGTEPRPPYPLPPQLAAPM
jgi:hypothetical protein